MWSVVYELTGYGADLEDAVVALSRWGARSLGEPGPDEIATAASMVMAMRTTFRAEAARGVEVGFELRMGEVVVRLRVDDGTLDAAEGALPDADLVIETGPAISALMAGEISPADAIADGVVRLTGDPQLLTRFVEVFRI
jgi:alkyl sulfatase BDS1-like metallo-beta-lactamase superfamily hydrolase